MEDIITAVRDDIVEKLKDGVGTDLYHGDLHHVLCNEDYFIIGTHKAKHFLGEYAFDVIGAIKEWEMDCMGESHTDFSDPEKTANMAAYVLGEHILSFSETYIACDDDLTADDITKITYEVSKVEPAAVLSRLMAVDTTPAQFVRRCA